MSDSFETKTDAELVTGAAYRSAPSVNVVGTPESVEMMRRLKVTMQQLHDTTGRLHARAHSLTKALLWFTIALFGVTIALFVVAVATYLATRH